MGKYIILVVVAAIVVLIPKIAWRIYLEYSAEQRRKEIVSKPFVCPNCGHRFFTQKKKIAFQRFSEVKAILKCPKCGKRDVCGRPYDLDDN